MNPITDKELDTATRNATIETLRIQQMDDKRYSLVVKLTWCAEELTLITQRKKVRGWVNLNPLVDRIREKYGITADINVTLTGETK
jgi:hypothetical protein